VVVPDHDGQYRERGGSVPSEPPSSAVRTSPFVYRRVPTLIALVQRVLWASVTIEGVETARTGPGTLALVGVERDDVEEDADRLATRLLGFRMFADAAGRMNLDLVAAGGSLLLVPQFTLAADTRRGRRPGFSTAAEPERAEALFEHFRARLAETVPETRAGTFGAHMQIASVNDGPVTFQLRSATRGVSDRA